METVSNFLSDYEQHMNYVATHEFTLSLCICTILAVMSHMCIYTCTRIVYHTRLRVRYMRRITYIFPQTFRVAEYPIAACGVRPQLQCILLLCIVMSAILQ